MSTTTNAAKPLVSAIIPTYNRAGLLARALDSVIDQDYRPIEVVVVDDGSTDNTEQVLEQYRKHLADAGVSLVTHRQRNERAPKARNVGMKLAHGELFAFLDSDDVWRPQFCSTLVRLLRQHRGAGLAFCGIVCIDYCDHVWKARDMGMHQMPAEGLMPRPFEQIMRYMPLQTSGVMVRRSVIDDVGDFDLELPVVEDWDLWYRVGKRYDFAYTQRGLACNRSHPDNLPKYDTVALNSSLKMNLKHLPDVKDAETRAVLEDRIQRQFTLLQEELLRQGKEANGYSQLLEHELAPKSGRFELASMIRDGPKWIGQSYGWLVRMLGEVRRSTQ
jgi:glycosyltransferase involved in cell wall biosynthesis